MFNKFFSRFFKPAITPAGQLKEAILASFIKDDKFVEFFEGGGFWILRPGLEGDKVCIEATCENWVVTLEEAVCQILQAREGKRKASLEKNEETRRRFS